MQSYAKSNYGSQVQSCLAAFILFTLERGHRILMPIQYLLIFCEGMVGWANELPPRIQGETFLIKKITAKVFMLRQ